MQKRVVAIHDISCFGRCSLTVALPVLSAAGIETSIIPTAVLSTHTGGFTGFTYRDLTDDILPIANHWKTIDIGFNAIYTGYLGSFEQLDIIAKVFDLYENEGTLKFVDPVMADHGKLYSTFSPDFPKGMAKLCAKADVIVPNMTEAVLMLNEEYINGPYTKEYIEHLLVKLGELGPEKVVLTGVYFDESQIGAATYDKKTKEINYIFHDKIPGSYHGTGDVFGSYLLGALLNGFDLNKATEIAVNFTTQAIQRTYEAKTDNRFGVNFEYSLGDFAKLMNPSKSDENEK